METLQALIAELELRGYVRRRGKPMEGERLMFPVLQRMTGMSYGQLYKFMHTTPGDPDGEP